jgi:hypothetical protein
MQFEFILKLSRYHQRAQDNKFLLTFNEQVDFASKCQLGQLRCWENLQLFRCSHLQIDNETCFEIYCFCEQKNQVDAHWTRRESGFKSGSALAEILCPFDAS